MSNPLYRAERCRDLANECRAIAALWHSLNRNTSPLNSRMAQHYSSLPPAPVLTQ
jgi:hypothetical protein